MDHIRFQQFSGVLWQEAAKFHKGSGETLKVWEKRFFRFEYKTFVQTYLRERKMLIHKEELLQANTKNPNNDTSWLPKVRLLQKRFNCYLSKD